MSSSTHSEYDIIFAGGGTVACVVAGRLIAAEPSLRILLVEAGPHTYRLQAHSQPARFLSHLDPTSKTVAFNVGTPSANLNGRSLIVPSGRCVGGGSSVNFMMYTRAAASDYDDWENVHNNPGWGSKDLIPLLRKTETFQVQPDRSTHGYSGPLKVSMGGAFSNIAQDFLDVAAGYDKERGFTEDVNGLYSCNMYGTWPKWIDGESGKRSDVPHNFIYDQKHTSNIKILDGCRVKRIVFENNRAVGVEYVKNRDIHPGAEDTVYSARASRLVVVSGGAFGSPTILERSGIGGRNILEKYRVEPIVDLPGVGQNYQDHNVVFPPYFTDDSAETLDAFFNGDPEVIEECTKQWIQDGKGLMAHNGFDAGIKLRPNADDLKELGPDFESRWKEYFANSPDKPVIWVGPVSAYVGNRSNLPRGKYYGVGYFTEYPVSTGSIHIASADDAHASPDFEPGYLQERADLATLKWGYKKAREISRRMPSYRGEFLPKHPVFPPGSMALCRTPSSPVHISAPDIVYSTKDDEAIDEFHRSFVQTAWHSLGTCAMKPRERGGVVDSKLNVYGIRGLKVADMSIAPSNVAANTYSTALVIGEKAALIIGGDLGLTGV